MLSDTTQQGLSDNWQTGWPQRIASGGWKCGSEEECRGRNEGEQSRTKVGGGKGNKGKVKALKVGRKKKKGAVEVTSRALRRSRRSLVLSLSSSAWLASGSAFAGPGGPGSGSV